MSTKKKKYISQFKTYQDSIDFFKNISLKKNEYRIKKRFLSHPNTNEHVHMQGFTTLAHEDLVKEQIDLDDKYGRSIVKQKAVKRFHPDNINNKDFWDYCRKEFPLLSVCGAEATSIKDVNKQNFNMAKILGFIDFVLNMINENKQPIRVFEIGCGYGNLFQAVKDKCIYTGIDYIIHKSLKKHKKNFIEINKSGIPDFLMAYEHIDIIYSSNVLQHCSQKERFEYFEQGYDILKPGGYFIFSMNMVTDENKNKNCWGVIDDNDIRYTSFFNQLTECDRDYEVLPFLKNIGYNIISIKMVNKNHALFLIQKPENDE